MTDRVRPAPDLLRLCHVSGADGCADAELAADGFRLRSQRIFGRQAVHDNIGTCTCKRSQDTEAQTLCGACKRAHNIPCMRCVRLGSGV